jgi:hypothetical protein
MRHDRQLAAARNAYLAPLNRLCGAIELYDARGDALPLEPGNGPQPIPWTADDVAVVQAKARAWAELATTRRQWDAMRREWQPPH